MRSIGKAIRFDCGDFANFEKYIDKPRKYADKHEKYSANLEKYASNPGKYAADVEKYTDKPGKYAERHEKYGGRCGKYTDNVEKYADRSGKYADRSGKYTAGDSGYTGIVSGSDYSPAHRMTQPCWVGHRTGLGRRFRRRIDDEVGRALLRATLSGGSWTVLCSKSLDGLKSPTEWPTHLVCGVKGAYR